MTGLIYIGTFDAPLFRTAGMPWCPSKFVFVRGSRWELGAVALGRGSLVQRGCNFGPQIGLLPKHIVSEPPLALRDPTFPKK